MNKITRILSYKLFNLDLSELREQAVEWENRLMHTGERLAKCVRTRDRMRRHQKRLCGAFSVLLRHISKLNNFLSTILEPYQMCN